MKITVIGAGYVGLVSGACFAGFGNEVVCVDTDQTKLDMIRAGQVPIYEPGLDALVTRTIASGHLRVSSSLAEPLAHSDVALIAVGTPPRFEDGEADLSYVYSVAREIGQHARDGLVVVIKSTVPVGTGREVERIIASCRPGLRFAVCSNPEFLKEGTAVNDFMKPDRIVLGTEQDWARARLEELYRPLGAQGVPLVFTRRTTAEVIKYAANAFLAAKISFINEIADLCEATDASVKEVSDAIGLDKRIGRAFLDAGPGFGGSCFPKDCRALVSSAQRYSVALRMVESSIAVNEARKRAMGGRIITALGGSVENTRIAVLGLTFKPDTDDMRESPAISIIAALQHGGAEIVAYDPKGMDRSRAYLNGVTFASNAYECVRGCDCAVLATGWQELRTLDMQRLAQNMRTRVLFDLRGVMDAEKAGRAGFEFHTIGVRKPQRGPTSGVPSSRVKSLANGLYVPAVLADNSSAPVLKRSLSD